MILSVFIRVYLWKKTPLILAFSSFQTASYQLQSDFVSNKNIEK
jgi:hypothetical protein